MSCLPQMLSRLWTAAHYKIYQNMKSHTLAHILAHPHIHTWAPSCGSQVQAERLISFVVWIVKHFGTTRRMHVAFYDFHTLSGRCPTAKFNYRIAAAGGCLVMFSRGEGGEGRTTTWRANYACRPGHLIGVFKGHTLTSHSQSFCASAYVTPTSPILCRLDPMLLYLLECFDIFERVLRALLV